MKKLLTALCLGITPLCFAQKPTVSSADITTDSLKADLMQMHGVIVQKNDKFMFIAHKSYVITGQANIDKIKKHLNEQVVLLFKAESSEIVEIIRVSEIKEIKSKPTAKKLDLKSFIMQKDVFNLSKDAFEEKWQEGLRGSWTDKFTRSSRTTEELQFNDLTSKETILKFRSVKDKKGKVIDRKFKGLRMMIFNQGDEGKMRESTFNAKVKSTLASLSKHIGAKPQFKANAGAAKTNIYFWLKMPHVYTLEFASSRVKPHPNAKYEFQAEFIRISINKGHKKMNIVNVDQANIDETLNSVEIKQMVAKKDDGTVYIDGLPMVDQGQKGYCACATTARILNYYGRDIDQHDIAKMALSSGDKGTQPDKLSKAIKKISSKLRLNMKVIVKCYLSTNNELKRFRKMMVKEGKKKGFDFSGPMWNKKETAEVFQELGKKDKRFLLFKKGIKKSIDSGRPLAWALMLGIVTEPEIPQANGGHMRTIIGYNEKTQKIYFSDSWGEGHEMKEMDMMNAFYVSMAVWEISPR